MNKKSDAAPETVEAFGKTSGATCQALDVMSKFGVAGFNRVGLRFAMGD
jgi:hypothetical protein